MLDNLIAEVDLILVLLLSNRKDLAERVLLELLYIPVVRFPLMELHVGVDLPQCLSEGRVEVILDVVISSPWEFSGDMCPLVTQFCLDTEEDLFFLEGPFAVVVDTRLELVVPPVWGAAYL